MPGPNPPVIAPPPPVLQPPRLDEEPKTDGATISAAGSSSRGWLLRPIRLQGCRGPWQFILRILTQQFAVKVAVGLCIGFLLPDEVHPHAEILRNPLLAFFLIVIWAPPIETLLLQAAPIELLRVFRLPRVLQFIVGSVPFALLHFPGGAAAGIGAGVVGGLFFSHTYLECRTRSWWTAAWVTTVTHSLHNLIVLPLAMAIAN